MLKEVPLKDGHILAPFFKEAYDSCPEAFIQGVMGRGFTDSTEEPTYGVIQIGDFCFFGGDASAPFKGHVIAIINNSFKNPNMIFIPLSLSWGQKFEEHTSYERDLRYALERTDIESFDKNALMSYINRELPDAGTIGESETCDFIIRPIDENYYVSVSNQEWSKDFTANYPDYPTFQKLGLGFVVIEQSTGRLVSGASSFSSSQDSIEIEINTAPDYRKKGLATSVSAKMVLACLERGKYPSWDAANVASVAIAEKLGYHLSEEYTCYRYTEEDFSRS